ncbi:MAG TPA: hypothetical protein VII52_07195 [Gemmatimonadaceae bacterium]
MFLDDTSLADGAAVCSATTFIDHLADLPPAVWLAIGRSEIAPDAHGNYATASALLDATLADQRLDAEAWHLRDLVDSAAQYALPSTMRAPRKERQAVISACALAERAALALLVRGSIGRQDFAALYAPFAQVLPPHVLGVPPQLLDGGGTWSALQQPLTPPANAPREA